MGRIKKFGKVLVSVAPLITSLVAIGTVAIMFFSFQNGIKQENEKSKREIDSQISQRLTTAITHLGSDSEAIRIGALYQLRRLAEDSERDRDSIGEIISTFMRDGLKKQNAEINKKYPDGVTEKVKLWSELNTALTTLSVLNKEFPHEVPIHLQETDFTSIDWPQIYLWLPGAFLNGARFNNIAMSHIDLNGAYLEDANFENANLCDSKLNGAELSGTNFKKANLIGASFISAKSLWGANFESAVFYDEADFNNIDKLGADLDHVNLTGANFKKAYLIRAQFKWATLEDTNFTNANLLGANLGRATILEADFENVNLFNADLQYTTITDTNLKKVRLAYAYLGNANIIDSNLQDANLEEADLEHVDLSGSNLKGANLKEANLEGADLSGVNLRGANLTDVIITEDTVIDTKTKFDPGVREKLFPDFKPEAEEALTTTASQ